jgi:cell division septal protein FtsQ
MSRPAHLAVPASQFQRGGGNARVKKINRHAPARKRQVLLATGLAVATIFAVRGVYVFIMSRPNLEVRNIQVTCPNPDVRAGVEQIAREMRWGNILRVDISRVRHRFSAYSWVKDVSVRKVFPDTVRVDVTPRQPVAVLGKNVPVLVDQEGIELGPAPGEARATLPVFTDTLGFAEDARNKVLLGVACLQELTAEDRADIASLDFSEPGDVVAMLRSSPTKLKLGEDLFRQKLALYRRTKDRWTQEFGPLEYMDLRFPDRIYIRTAEAKDGPSPSRPDKEAR